MFSKGRAFLASQSRARILLFALITLATAYLLSRPLGGPSAPHSSFPSFPQDSHVYPGEPHAAALNQTRPKRVAIIGAGAGGSSAAWFLSRAGRVVEERLGVGEGSILGEIVVVDKLGHVGGLPRPYTLTATGG